MQRFCHALKENLISAPRIFTLSLLPFVRHPLAVEVGRPIGRIADFE